MIARAISAKRNQALPSMEKFMRQVSIAAFYFGVSREDVTRSKSV